MLRLALALHIFTHEQMVAIEYDISELVNPVAKDNHPCLFRQLKVKFYVTMAVDEAIDVGMSLHILLGEQHEMLAVLTHIGRFLTLHVLQAAVLSPVLAEPHAPSRMDGREQDLAETVVEHGTQHLELPVGVAKAIAMGKEEHLAVNLRR